ncbi:MAG TPA: histidinol-phosphate transaminase [Gaiellaceae bacterium]
MPPRPRPAGSGFEAYRWAATVGEVAARHGLSPAHVLRFDANVPAFTAPLPLPAGSALAQRGVYPEGSYRALREAAAAYAGCEPDEVAVDAGADGLIALVARTYLGAGALAVTETPTYPVYAIASRIEGAEVRTTARDLDALAEAGREARVVWLCNPGNPSGEMWPAAEIVRLADALSDALVAVDEAYFEYGGETVAKARPNVVAIRTLSKAFGFAGLRVGYAIASPEVAAALGERRSPAPIATTAARIAAAALREPQIDDEVTTTISERERVRSALAAVGFETPPVHANFVVARTPEAPRLAAELEARGLVVRGYADSLRITVRSPADDDLVLRALGADPPPADRRSVTVFRQGVRVSVVIDGSGRVRSATGDPRRDREIEQRTAESGFDLDLVADESARDEDIAGALDEAIA